VRRSALTPAGRNLEIVLDKGAFTQYKPAFSLFPKAGSFISAIPMLDGKREVMSWQITNLLLKGPSKAKPGA